MPLVDPILTFTFVGFGGGSSWADEVEETSTLGTQALPPTDRSSRYNSNSASSWQDRGMCAFLDDLIV
jgi:hypothetical protein